MTPPVRSRLAFGALLSAGLVLGGTSLASGTTVAIELKPNVKPIATASVSIRYSATNKKQLRLSYEAENAGMGPLELVGKQEDCNGNGDLTDDRTVYQEFYVDTNADGSYTPGVDMVDPSKERVAGCFTFDIAHGHWHFANYATFQLFDLQGHKAGTHSKVGFCLIDVTQVEPSLPGSPSSGVYESCAPDVQGSSIGWADIYDEFLPGQFINIQGVPDGRYCLVSTGDPKNKIQETDETDNVVRTPLKLKGDNVAIGTTPC